MALSSGLTISWVLESGLPAATDVFAPIVFLALMWIWGIRLGTFLELRVLEHGDSCGGQRHLHDWVAVEFGEVAHNEAAML